VRIATNKIASLTEKLSNLRRSEPKARDNRIFPMVYAGVIVQHNGENLLRPMRYACRPAGNRLSTISNSLGSITRTATT
jgi:hypothetical protein